MSYKIFNECFNKRIKRLFRMCIYLSGYFTLKESWSYWSDCLWVYDWNTKKKDLEDIPIKQTNKIDSLPGDGNMGLKKKEINSCVNEKTFIDVTK